MGKKPLASREVRRLVVLSGSLRKAFRRWSPRRRRRRGDKIERDVVVRRLNLFRCRAAFNQVERAYRDGYG
jgi:hypothetical protein